jgi:putative oxidoreductase
LGYKIKVMGITTRFQYWNHTHQSLLLFIARIVLGLILLLKGIFFFSHAQELKGLILASRFAAGVGFWAGYVSFAHFFGGVFLILGLLTRLSALLQLPVILGALLFILPRQGVVQTGPDMVLSLVVLALLVLVLIKGAGNLSMDAYLKTHLL